MIFEKVELLNGAIRFTPFWLILDLLLLIHFAASWIYSARKTGWKIDFFYLTLLQTLVIPVLFVYPFNGSFHNLFTIGVYPFFQADSCLDQAFAITLLGYIGVWVGSYLFAISEIHRFSNRLISIFQPLETCVVKNISSKKCLYFLFYLSLALTVLITLISSLNGYFLRPRLFFQMNDLMRPLYNLTISIASILLAFLSARFLQSKEKWCKILLIISLSISIFYGIRSVLIGALFFYYTFSIFKKQGRFKMTKFIPATFLFILLALELEKIREGLFLFDFSLTYFSAIYLALAYGNHFSDTRDFAWVLANWENEYLLGLSYIANILSFIPSSVLSLRQEYSLTNYTSNLIGLDLSTHNGVRPGFFGQIFFNFSYLAVFLGGILQGMVLKLSNLKLKQRLLETDNIVEAYGKTVAYFCISSLLFSHVYWSFYLFILINVSCAILRRFKITRAREITV